MTEPTEATEVPTLEFEGQPIENLLVYIPATKLEVDQAFARGTYLTLKMEFRVRSVRMEEDRKGVLSRHAVLAFDGDAAIVSIDTPEERLAQAVANGDVEYVQDDEIPTPDDDREVEVEDEGYEPRAEVTEQSVEEVFA